MIGPIRGSLFPTSLAAAWRAVWAPLPARRRCIDCGLTVHERGAWRHEACGRATVAAIAEGVKNYTGPTRTYGRSSTFARALTTDKPEQLTIAGTTEPAPEGGPQVVDRPR